MVEAEGVHDLVEGPADVAEAVALLTIGVRRPEGQLLAPTSSPNIRPAPEIVIN